MVSRIISEILLITLTVSVIGSITLSIILQQQALNQALTKSNIVTLSYVTCNSSSILVYNYGFEDIEVKEVYVNNTQASFTLLVYDPTSKSWSPSTSIPPRRLALIKVSLTLTSSTSTTLVTSKGVWSHTCS